MRRILIVGAYSAIAQATAREFARRGDALYLVGRDREKLQSLANDLRVRGASSIEIGTLDVREYAKFGAVLDDAERALGGLDTALIAQGVLPDQASCERSSAALIDQFEINGLSVLVMCTELASRFEAKRRGMIAVISSVAGDRGRRSNFAYGSAKAAVTAFTSGLRQRLRKSGVRVLTIKPGFVDTPMTVSFRKGVLWAKPAAVGRSIARAMIRESSVVYLPWFWRPIMAIVRSIPEFVFQRLEM
jgi:decaprenylphospho-beta-D-erythro-pentofuranosid-2-ulose 2-reductase